jgi:hypothetical protein
MFFETTTNLDESLEDGSLLEGTTSEFDRQSILSDCRSSLRELEVESERNATEINMKFKLPQDKEQLRVEI